MKQGFRLPAAVGRDLNHGVSTADIWVNLRVVYLKFGFRLLF